MDGLYRIINGKLINVPYSPHDGKGTSDRQIRQFTEDSQHNIWFGTFSGLEKYNPQTGLYTKIQIPQHVGGLSHPSLFALYTDRQGIIWLGSYYGGVSYFNPGKEEYLHYNYQSHAQPGIYYSYIGEMVQDNERNLWISTDGGGISQIGPGWNLLKQFTAGKADGLPHNNIKSIVYDPHRNNLYIGTYLGGLSRYDIRQHTFHNYRNRADNPGDIIYHLEIWNDKLYLTTRKGLFCLDPDTDTFQFLSNTSSFCEYFDISPQGTLYIMGWNYVDIFSLTDNTLTRRISMTPYDCYGNLSHILATDQGAYISTLGSGIYFYNAKSHEVTHYTHANSQLPSDYCYNIARVDEHSIAISTDKGITLFTPEKRQASTIVLPAEIPLIYGGGLYVSPQHEIYIGGPKGITMVPAESFRSNAAHNSPLYFSRLWINNRLVTPLSADNILDQTLPFTHKLKLKHNQTVSSSLPTPTTKNSHAGKPLNTSLKALTTNGFPLLPTRFITPISTPETTPSKSDLSKDQKNKPSLYRYKSPPHGIPPSGPGCSTSSPLVQAASGLSVTSWPNGLWLFLWKKNVLKNSISKKSTGPSSSSLRMSVMSSVLPLPLSSVIWMPCFRNSSQYNYTTSC